MTTVIQNRNSALVTVYSEANEVMSLAKRIKVAVPGGSRLQENEATALAQVALATNCNPFIGEVWYISGSGPMIGIKGMRRHGDEQIKQAGSRDDYWTQSFKVVSPEEAGAPPEEIKNVVAAYKCVVNDSVSTRKHQKLLVETINAFREAGDKDPVGSALEVCGRRPEWIGYGYATSTEKSRMNKQSLAMKRAEADALKRRFNIPFGASVAAADSAQDAADDWLEGEAVTPPPSEQETKAEQGMEATERPYTPEQLKERIQLFANKNQRENRLNATQAQRGLAAGVLNECFAGDPDSDKIRHSVLKYLIGYNSLSAKDGAPGIYVIALLDWLKPEKDSGGAYHADETASKEARAVWTQALKDAGQAELGL